MPENNLILMMEKGKFARSFFNTALLKCNKTPLILIDFTKNQSPSLKSTEFKVHYGI